MSTDLDYSDLPIDHPQQDLFGIDPFVRTLAASIRRMKSPKGVVIALNGPWGSGKSSAISLLRHHLQDAVNDDELRVVTFNPWWFRGEEALALAFFRELYAATEPSLADGAKKLLPKLGARLMKAGKVVAAAAESTGLSAATGVPGGAKVAAAAMDWLSDMIEDGESVEKLHGQLANNLAQQQRRFLIVIDDIDRLAPDEALAMFRLVKSVGRLPNVIYLLAFDRLLAEAVVAERFPSEGPHYLEKIVQASFEIPPPDQGVLNRYLFAKLQQIAEIPADELTVDIMNLFQDIVSPEIQSPRDAIRYLNAFSITWPAVAGEVHFGDFIALEAYRLFRPEIYRAVRTNPGLICGAAVSWAPSSISADQLDALLLSSASNKDHYRRGLKRLFPKLQSIWSNVFHDEMERWDRQRRICVPDHFPVYFRLSISPDSVSRTEVNQVIASAGDAERISKYLREAAQARRRGGGTRAALLLDALTLYAVEIPDHCIESFLSGVFAVADEIDVDDDEEATDIVNNGMRIFILLRSLLLRRFELPLRSRTIMGVIDVAPLGLLATLANHAWTDYYPMEGTQRTASDKCLFTQSDTDRLAAKALQVIRGAARSGALIQHRGLKWLLLYWRKFAKDGGASVKRWTGGRLNEDQSVVRFAEAFLSASYTQGMGFGDLGDLASQRHDCVSEETLRLALNVDRFRSRLEDLERSLPPGSQDHATVTRFLNAWRDTPTDR